MNDWLTDIKPIHGPKTKKGKVIQVKSGRIKPSDVRDFCHVVERESAEMNFFVSLRKQSKEIALAMGLYTILSEINIKRCKY